MYDKVSGVQACEWVSSVPCCDTGSCGAASSECADNYVLPNYKTAAGTSKEKACCACGKGGSCKLKSMYVHPNHPDQRDTRHWLKYCEKFTNGRACANDRNVENFQEYKEAISTPSAFANQPPVITYRDITWERFFTNSDTTTCPTLECAFTQKQTNTVVPKEFDHVQVLRNQFLPYGKTNAPAGWKFERSIQCRTRDAFHDSSVAPMTKAWALTLTIKQERNCPRYLKPLPNILAAPVLAASGVFTPFFYPGNTDPLYDPTFLPDPLDFTALKYVNKQTHLDIDPMLFFKEEIFTSDKQCILTLC